MTAYEGNETSTLLFLYVILIQVCKSNVTMSTLTLLFHFILFLLSQSAVLFIFLPKKENCAFEFLKRYNFHKHVRLTGKTMGEGEVTN